MRKPLLLFRPHQFSSPTAFNLPFTLTQQHLPTQKDNGNWHLVSIHICGLFEYKPDGNRWWSGGVGEGLWS